MKLRYVTGLVAITCGLLASCYPYKETPRKKKPKKPTTEEKVVPPVTPEEKAKQELEAAKKKAAEEARKKALAEANQAANPTLPPTREITGPTAPQNPPPDAPQPQPQAPKRIEYVYANKVPGREGFVFSPYNNKVVDVRGIPSGKLVMDPTYPESEKKYFRVP